jgi:hypothetical protein
MSDFGWEAVIAILFLPAHYQPMEWDLVSADFDRCAREGALCDISVQATTLSDWQAVIDKLREKLFVLEFRIGGETRDLPHDVTELLYRHSDDPCPSLYVRLGETSLNCHFFTDEEIEFDLNPREIHEELLPSLLDFLRVLGEATKKQVILTLENAHEAAIMRFDPITADVEYVGPLAD